MPVNLKSYIKQMLLQAKTNYKKLFQGKVINSNKPIATEVETVIKDLPEKQQAWMIVQPTLTKCSKNR